MVSDVLESAAKRFGDINVGALLIGETEPVEEAWKKSAPFSITLKVLRRRRC